MTAKPDLFPTEGVMMQRILLYDLEITPILGWVYDMYDARVLKVERPKYIMCFAYKWLDEDEIHVVTQPDFPLYKKDKHNDREVVKALHKLFDEADIVVAHNAYKFDNRVANARFAYHKMAPPSPYKTVDTLRVARREFAFGANSLAFLSEQLELGSKPEVTHADLWGQCIDGDCAAWEKMRAYNKQDIVLLEALYLYLRPFMPNHPVVHECNCPKCGSSNIQYRGKARTKTMTYRRIQCNDCGSWSRERKSDPTGTKPRYV